MDLNWDSIGAIGEIIGAVGVIASLFYLGRQLRQNSKTISDEIFQRLLTNYHTGMDLLLRDPDAIRIFYLGLRDYYALSEDERSVWVTQLHAFLRRYENIVLQSKKHDVDLGVIESIQRQWHQLLGQPGAKTFWPRAYKSYSDEFVDFVAQRHNLRFEIEADDT